MISRSSSVRPARLGRAQRVGDLGLGDPEQAHDPGPYVVAPAIAARNASVARARLPHRLKLARRPGQHHHRRARHRRPAARPARARSRPDRASSTPAGSPPACGWRRGSRRASSPGQRRIIGAQDLGDPLLELVVEHHLAAAKRPTISAVRSSAVGPRPPLVMITAIPWSRMYRSAASRSSGRSPTIWIIAASTPSSRRRSDSHGPVAVGDDPGQHLGAGDQDPRPDRGR